MLKEFCGSLGVFDDIFIILVEFQFVGYNPSLLIDSLIYRENYWELYELRELLSR